MDYAEIATQAAILIAVLAPASAALVDIAKRLIPSLGGERAATVAGVLCAAATMCALRPMLPETMTGSDWVMVVAIVLLSLYSPKVVRDYARAPKKADDHALMHEEFNDDQGEGT